METPVQIPLVNTSQALEGILKVPSSATGIVLFAHGSGSSRFSPRNTYVADILNEAGLATLLIDLLSSDEDAIYQTRFDINLLVERLHTVVNWLTKHTDTQKLALGLFGASTGAASALQLASELKGKIKAVVSRGGRPDLALSHLAKVTAPTLLIVGGDDFGVIELNQQAFAQLNCEKQLEIIPHASHLFEEPGALPTVAKLAKGWFLRHLTQL